MKDVELRFRPAEERDAAVIGKLRREIWGTTYRGIYPDEVIDRFDVEGHLRRDLGRIADPAFRVWVIEDGERPIGYLYLERRTGVHIQSLYVLREYQGRGIGRAAFALVRDCCRAWGLETFTCNCNAHNAPARGFYEHLGGVLIGADVGHENRQEDQVKYLFQTEQ